MFVCGGGGGVTKAWLCEKAVRHVGGGVGDCRMKGEGGAS